LVSHDRRDFKVPLAEGQAIVRAWPRGELVMTRGLGHHKILRDAVVIARAVEFLERRKQETKDLPRKLEPVRPRPVRDSSPAIALAPH